MADDSLDDALSASRGDDAALERVLTRHLSGLRAFVRLRAGPVIRARESASDIVQSACREVLRDLDPANAKGEEEFRRWLYQAALRKLLDRARHHGAAARDPRREIGGDIGEDWMNVYASVATPSRRAMSREEIERIEKAFDSLDEAQREVILLARLLDLSHEEIARTMGRSELATRSLLSRALARLATLLEQGDR